jgi:DNA replication factor GINS
MASELTSLLLHTRLEKTIQSDGVNFTNLLDEEKFIIDSEEQKIERTEMILSATINGKSKYLESISLNHKTKTVVLRFLQEVDEILGADLKKYGPFKPEDVATLPYENAQALIVDEILGADLKKYGPFKPEDVATLPYENAQALITKKIATKIHWED